MRRTAIFLATGAYTGFAPVAPGTAGSLLAAAVLMLLPEFATPMFGLATVGLLLVGVWAASEGERHFHQTDAPQVVIDEIVGMMVSVLWLPAGWLTVALALLWFRIFDILKPFPVRQAENGGALLGRVGLNSPRLFHLAGGVGVMLDDVVAGIYANLAVRVCLYFLH